MTNDDLRACLPPELRAADPKIERIRAGMSGAGVYRVEAAGRSYVLKIAGSGELVAAWRQRVEIQRRAAAAGVAPAMIHVDEERQAIVSEHVADRSFPAFYATPQTREAAVTLLGTTLRRVHELPLPAGATGHEPRAFLATLWPQVAASIATPEHVGATVRRVLEDEMPAAGAPVLCHNDVNPSNLVYDGARVLLLDWDTAGPNEPYYDLAAAAVFLRMDDETCARLIEAHDGVRPAALPARFRYDRHLVAALCGTLFLHLARMAGHAGASGGETLATTLSLVDIYQQMRAGTLDIASAEGQWRFGLALVKASAELR